MSTDKAEEPTLAVIGGSGLYEMPGALAVGEHHPTTPFGAPSDGILEARIGSTRVLFLPRHGRGHRLAPHEVPYRANLFALKKLGASQVLAVSAVGSLREDLPPGTFVTVDQYLDRTRSRPATFFESRGVVVHVGFGDPVDHGLRRALFAAAQRAGARVVDRGVYVCIEGPQFSTRAESEGYRREGASVIGMTNLPEARLAREAELPYASLSMVTDYDCWHPSEAEVDVAAVLRVMKENAELAQRTIMELAGALPDPTHSPATHALRGAILTAPAAIPGSTREELGLLLGAYLDHGAAPSR